ncbi:WD-40 repeat-containing protein, partial [Planoprotostelium fungivorum]
FDASESSLKPFQTLRCNDKRMLDFAFVNSGSLIASAGISTNKQNVCLWDTLLPSSRSLVRVFPGQEGGASSVCYSPMHQLLITGSKKGDIIIYDIRQQKVLESITRAHSMNVKTLAVSQQEDSVMSGSSEGNLKLWDLPSFTCRESWEDVHAKQTFVRKPGVFAATVSTYGVMQVVAGDKTFYTCGSDGRIMKLSYDKGQTRDNLSDDQASLPGARKVSDISNYNYLKNEGNKTDFVLTSWVWNSSEQF